MSACTRTLVPIGTKTVALPTPTNQPQLQISPSPSIEIGTDQYAVVWVGSEETLIVRKPAGISGTAVSELAYDQRGIKLTGSSTRLGSSTWVEIHTPAGGTGWVNAWNLTEDILPSQFCEDARVNNLLEVFVSSLIDEDAEALNRTVHPERGLVIRHDWWNPDVIFLPNSVNGLFSDLTEIDWGVLGGSEFHILGSFRQIILPQIEDVFFVTPESKCNEMIAGVTNQAAIWPIELGNMNFYVFHRPSPEDGNRYDWRTLAIGIEYTNNQPNISIVILYRGDI
ncbi:MAG TPA: SH3 domain-containing protein [Anaerolineae bacterium]|nr:SH3 domain-containing protein [Anaerolineae bacterium]